MGGYIQLTLDLIQRIESETNKKQPLDLFKFKDVFMQISNEIMKISNYNTYFSASKESKIEAIKNAESNKEKRVLIAYLNLLEGLKSKKDAMAQAGIICLMIPVICELMRECER